MVLHKQNIFIQWFGLVFIALLCGAIWRIELEHHGWHGLIWIGYFHWAILIDYIIFIIWCNFMISFGKIYQRVLFNSLLLFYGILVFYLLEVSLMHNFMGGPSGFVLFMTTPYWLRLTYKYLLPFTILLMPFIGFVTLRIFKKKTPYYKLLLALGLIIVLTLSSPYILEIINHKGSHNYIHAIKSGLIIPFWIISVGSVLIGNKTN